MLIAPPHDEPTHGRTAAIRAVRALDPTHRLFVDVAYGKLATSLPHRVFELHPETEVTATTLLAGARGVGWRYLIEHDGSPASLAELRSNAAGHHVVRSFTPAGVARAFLDAVIEAERRRESSARRAGHAYELRALRVPSLFITCVWLHADDRDFFIPIANHPPISAGKAYTTAELARSIQPALVHRLRPLSRSSS